MKGRLNLYSLDPALRPRVASAIESSYEVGDNAAFDVGMAEIHAADAVTRSAGLFDNYLALGDSPSLMRIANRWVNDAGDSDAFASRAAAKCVGEDDQGALVDANHAIVRISAKPITQFG